MRLENKFNYPEPFARAVAVESYDRGDADYTVSELISPPRLRQLVKRHDAEITEDVSDRLWVILGTVAHDILERAGAREAVKVPADPEYMDLPHVEYRALHEERLYATVAGKRIGGKLDTLDLSSGLLTDYKVTSVWSYILGTKPEWERQLNAYAFLARENGHKVESLEIFAMFRDWMPSKAQKNDDYPKTNCLRIPVKLWSHDEAQIWLAGRVLAHETASVCSDEDLVPCSAEERWAKPTTYAVMKPGRKSALSVHDTEQDAWKAMSQGLRVETRPGKSVRCESYCSARDFCSQWAADPMNPKNALVEVV